MTDMNDMLSTTAAKHDENRATARFSCYQCATNPLARRFPVGLGWPSLPEALTESSGLAPNGFRRPRSTVAGTVRCRLDEAK